MTENKLTQQQEKFVRLIAEGKSQHQAYLEAYPKSKDWLPSSVDCEASKLASNTKVLQRLDDIRNKADIKTVETIEKLTNELNTVLQQALSLEQTSSAVSAIMGKAKLLGLIVDKTDNKNTTTVKVEMPTIKKDGKEIEFKIG